MTQIVAIFLSFCGLATADTVQVTVGNVGCTGRQNGVKECWQKVPGVVSVKVLSPVAAASGATQRVFAIVSKATAPAEQTLREALGRRAEHYPILRYLPEQPRLTPTGP